MGFFRAIDGGNGYNNRTGYSIAFVMLYSCLVPAVLRSSVEETADSSGVSYVSSVEISEFSDKLGIRAFRMRELCGGNPWFRPFQDCRNVEVRTLDIAASTSVLLNTL